jgi:hypothetical protein
VRILFVRRELMLSRILGGTHPMLVQVEKAQVDPIREVKTKEIRKTERVVLRVLQGQQQEREALQALRLSKPNGDSIILDRLYHR